MNDVVFDFEDPVDGIGGARHQLASALASSGESSPGQPPQRRRRHLTSRDFNELADPAKGGGGQCRVCNKTFVSTSHLRRHILTHTGEKPYMCPYCPHTSARLDNLKIHMAVKHQRHPSAGER